MGLNKEELANRLGKYIPLAATSYVSEFVIEHRVHLHIKSARTTRLGDYRPPQQGNPHRISVNNDLNPYAFLITLTHEMSHLLAWIRYKNSIKPHGIEWKAIYTSEMLRWLQLEIFPEHLAAAVVQHLDNPRASTCADPELYRVLRTFDRTPAGTVLNELAPGEWFTIKGGRVFQKGNLRRTRYICMELHSQRYYAISGETVVESLPPPAEYNL